HLLLEQLEDRNLLATANLIGVPDWVNQGPGPIEGGQAQSILAGTTVNPVAGAVTAIAPDPNDASIVFVGTANGGIWKTMNATAAHPTWTPLTDQFPALSLAALAFSPLRPAATTPSAGTR